jgi:spermidine synthase
MYEEDNRQDNGAIYKWYETILKDSILSHRGTKIEMVERPGWGTTCFMDGAIQSCEIDEYLYHETLVHPVMISSHKRNRVMIIGGGEGATAREVLKWPDVTNVDMYEWDKDVVELFKARYPQWAKGAWEDSRLTIYYDDIFEKIKEMPSERYDVIIIDLFDPTNDNLSSWYHLFMNLHNWIDTQGSIVLYTGMRNIAEKEQMYHKLMKIIKDSPENGILPLHTIMIPYRIFIPSFLGESTFVLLQSRFGSNDINFKNIPIQTHITHDVWSSYNTFNW